MCALVAVLVCVVFLHAAATSGRPRRAGRRRGADVAGPVLWRVDVEPLLGFDGAPERDVPSTGASPSPACRCPRCAGRTRSLAAGGHGRTPAA